MLQLLLVLCIYDWLALGKPATYLQRINIEKCYLKCNISRRLKLQAYNLLWIYSYKANHSTMHSYVVEFPTILNSFYQHQKHLQRGGG